MSALGTLNLHLDITRKQAVSSLIREEPFTLPGFTFGEVIRFIVEIFQWEGVPNAFKKPQVSGMGLEFTLTDIPANDASGATAFVTQYSWSQNSIAQTLEADVAFNTTNLSTWLSTASSKPAMLRFVLLEGTNRTEILRQQITIYAGSTTVGAVDPGSTPATWERSVATFMPKVDNAGDAIIMISPGGNKFRFYPDDDGQPHFDPVT